MKTLVSDRRARRLAYGRLVALDGLENTGKVRVWRGLAGQGLEEAAQRCRSIWRELGRALEGASFAARPGEEQQKVALQLFRERRILLVWDNFESTLPRFQHLPAPRPRERGRHHPKS
jgi:hypothetical protein